MTTNNETKKPLSALQRVEKLEMSMELMQGSIDGLLPQFRSAFMTLTETMEGMMEVLKESTADFDKLVQAKVDARRQARMLAKVEQEKNQIEQMVQARMLYTVTTVGENSLIVAKLFRDGVEVPPGRIQFEVARLPDAQKAPLLGKGVLDTVELGNEKLEVLEIYDINLTPNPDTTAVAPAKPVDVPAPEVLVAEASTKS